MREDANTIPRPWSVDRTVFPSAETSVAQARRWLRELLAGHPRCDDAVLLLSETFTNSVVHTRSAAIGVVLLVEENDRLQVEVVDEGAETSPCVCGHSGGGDLAESGRGIRLLRALSDQWGFIEEHPRCVVWFTLGPPPPPVE
ncbi:ATP-binding protein [Sphaerisporangium siamense]|uniref:Anti-sigma regulatory factor (Ser/Thr protein kinase) n=1 Tax=Sphaerisporangium siamense TaxID=795645 RepID=A0A7W7GDB3_9ACTN|nr:ATP-binding protein [Sphaerisporangium siamense]MBB4702836.1 anti-sigma regulatory factor (Ser/Thr protein kinase) [Sphaerisporangium siamense]GII83408.1 ATP-binding protein [Sphaerisporangium siamense]